VDPDELIKAVPVIAKGAGALAAAIPFTGIVKRMLGPAADELAEMWRDQVRMYRYDRQLKCVEKAERMAEKAGFTPKAVPPKILFPLLEGASVEQNEDLHTMWAALLANASSSCTADLVRPSFCEVLKLMTSDVARLLNFAFDSAVKKAHPTVGEFSNDLGIELQELEGELQDRKTGTSSLIDEIRTLSRTSLGTYRTIYRRFAKAEGATDDMLEGRDGGIHEHGFAVAMDELERMQMWSTTERRSGDHYYLSAFAVQFVMVCRQPAQRTR